MFHRDKSTKTFSNAGIKFHTNHLDAICHFFQSYFFNEYCNLFKGKLLQNKNLDKFSSMKRAQNRRCIALRDQVTEIHQIPACVHKKCTYILPSL